MTLLERILQNMGHPLARVGGEDITLFSIVRGLFVMALAAVLANLTTRGLVRLLERQGVTQGAMFALSKMARYLVLMLGAAMALTSIGIRLDALFAASAVLFVGIGFGLQNIAQNFVSGIVLLIERPVARGDYVKIGDTLGMVVDIGLRATHVVTRDEVTIIVPNSQLVTDQVINHSVPSNNLRIMVSVGVAYGTDTALVSRTLLQVAADEPGVLREPAPEVRFDAFAESSLTFSLLIWINSPREDLRTASRLRFAIDAAFRQAGITIPFPQRELHLRTGAESFDRLRPVAVSDHAARSVG
jgi:small-conductance mechanosensitive channel